MPTLEKLCITLPLPTLSTVPSTEMSDHIHPPNFGGVSEASKLGAYLSSYVGFRTMLLPSAIDHELYVKVSQEAAEEIMF